jgi:ATP-dependent DNA helicase DinG
MPGAADDAEEALGRLVAHLPGGGESRPGQVTMARAVADAATTGRHLVVQAGTGTGKSLAYLVGALAAGRRVLVVTATKALQDQLAERDLPFLAAHRDAPLRWAVLKGRANYVCRQRLAEVTTPDGRLELDEGGPALRRDVARLASWAGTSPTGDQAELDWSPSPRAWAAVSVSALECPGAARCPQGATCFAEAARRRAEDAEVVVVNTHLYGLGLGAGGAVLPEHDVVVVDEAHQLEDVVAATAGVTIGPGRLPALARLAGAVIADDELGRSVARAGDRLADALRPHRGRRLADPLPPTVGAALLAARGEVDAVLGALRAVPDDAGADVRPRVARAQQAASHLVADVDLALRADPDRVRWVDGSDLSPALQVASVDVGPLLRERAWKSHVAVLTSATIPPGLPRRVALPAEETDELDVGSPFDYGQQALLYCATHLPDPRSPAHRAAVHDELAALVTAAGGRTLALFTSWAAMTAAADALRPRLPYEILTQADLPKPALVDAFRANASRCLFATAGLFQGIDVPGDTLALVTIDRIPFPRPDDPLLQARRDRAGAAAFADIDVPRAATLLAQAAGRLVRSATDRGVVAVFDPRLNSASYRWDLVRALPPMRRTRHRHEAEAFLRDIAGAATHDAVAHRA